MAFRVRLDSPALSYLQRLDRSVQERIGRRIDQLAEGPYAYSKPLEGTEGLRASRVGDYRLILKVKNGELLVLVLKIAPRGEVYRKLGREG